MAQMTERTRYKAKFEEGLQSGLFSIENAFELVQNILQSTRKKAAMRDEDILGYLESKGMLLQSDDYGAQLKQYKWREVMKFMQGNPQVLM